MVPMARVWFPLEKTGPWTGESLTCRFQAVVPKGQMHLYGAAVVYVDFAKIQQHHCIEVSTPARR